MAETLPELKSYCSKDWADAFFASFLWSTNWDDASDKQKLAALCTATNLIQRFTLFYDDSGEAFTYDPAGTLEIPDLLKEATAKEAIYLLSLDESIIEPNGLLTMGIQSANGVVFSKDFQGDILTISVRNLIRSMGGEILPGASADDNGGIVQGRTVR